MTYGLQFQCDPMAGFLDRPLDDLPVLLALTDVAREAIRAANEQMRDG